MDNFFKLNQELPPCYSLNIADISTEISGKYLAGDILKEQSHKETKEDIITTNFRFIIVRPNKNGQLAHCSRVLL